MANALFGFPNFVDVTTYPVGFSGGNWATTLPTSNLADPLLASVARSIDATLASTQVEVDLGTARVVRLMAIPKHNLSAAALWRIRGSNAAGEFGTPLYDSGWIAPFSATDEELAEYAVAALHIPAAAPAACRYWRLEINDTANPDGYVELARLVMASTWQPTYNMSVGATFGWSTDTQVERSMGSVDYYDPRPTRRLATVRFDHLTTAEAMANGAEMQRRLGIHRQLFFVWDPEDADQLRRWSFLCTLKELNPIEFPYVDATAVPFQLQEVL